MENNARSISEMDMDFIKGCFFELAHNVGECIDKACLSEDEKIYRYQYNINKAIPKEESNKIIGLDEYLNHVIPIFIKKFKEKDFKFFITKYAKMKIFAFEEEHPILNYLSIEDFDMTQKEKAAYKFVNLLLKEDD